MKYLTCRNKHKILHITINTLIFATYSKAALAGNNNTKSVSDIVTFVVDWVWQIGLLVAFIGSIQFALGFQNNDAHHKVHGLRTVAAGFMVAAVSKSLNLFGL